MIRGLGCRRRGKRSAERTVTYRLGALDSGGNDCGPGQSPFRRGESRCGRGTCPCERGNCPCERGNCPFERGNCPFERGNCPFERGNCPCGRGQQSGQNGGTIYSRTALTAVDEAGASSSVSARATCRKPKKSLALAAMRVGPGRAGRAGGEARPVAAAERPPVARAGALGLTGPLDRTALGALAGLSLGALVRGRAGLGLGRDALLRTTGSAPRELARRTGRAGVEGLAVAAAVRHQVARAARCVFAGPDRLATLGAKAHRAVGAVGGGLAGRGFGRLNPGRLGSWRLGWDRRRF